MLAPKGIIYPPINHKLQGSLLNPGIKESSRCPGRSPHAQTFLSLSSLEVSLDAVYGHLAFLGQASAGLRPLVYIRYKSHEWHVMCLGLMATGRLRKNILPTPCSQHQDGPICQLRRMSAHIQHVGPVVAAPDSMHDS